MCVWTQMVYKVLLTVTIQTRRQLNQSEASQKAIVKLIASLLLSVSSSSSPASVLSAWLSLLMWIFDLSGEDYVFFVIIAL